MHELSITQGIIDICTNSAGGERVTSVVLEIGDLSGVVPESLEFCFDVCTRDTPLEGARLIIERVPAKGKCGECAAEFPISAFYEACPSCGSQRVSIVSGRELRVKELEVD
jgi:hydrogenase nickel incorporation protein HypA/HybF